MEPEPAKKYKGAHRTTEEIFAEEKFLGTEPATSRKYRKRPLRELSCEDMAELYRVYNTEHYSRAVVARMFRVSEVLVTKLATAIDRDSDYINKRRQKATAK